MALSRRLFLPLPACLPLSLPRAASAQERPLTVFAAASLTNVLQEAGDAYTKQTGKPVRFSFAASSALARQVEAGAPADVFISADQEWMDYLQQKQRVQAAHAAALGKDGRIATGDPSAVPVVGAFPADTHEPIRYPAAALAGASPESGAFLAFLRGAAAQALFDKAGFERP